jgi:hypothetical protein
MPEYKGPERRHPDPIQEEIEEAIRLASDPKDRAFLLILNKIAGNLDENTQLTRSLTMDLKAHTTAFEQHEKDEMALINQGRGFWRASLVSLVVLQGVLVWWVQDHLKETEQIKTDVLTLKIDVVQNKEQIKLIWENKGNP